MGIPAGELEQRMSAAELREHMALARVRYSEAEEAQRRAEHRRVRR